MKLFEVEWFGHTWIATDDKVRTRNPGRIDVRELGHRWAACSPQGNLAFHWKCMMAPPTIIVHATYPGASAEALTR